MSQNSFEQNDGTKHERTVKSFIAAELRTGHKEVLQSTGCVEEQPSELAGDHVFAGTIQTVAFELAMRKRDGLDSQRTGVERSSQSVDTCGLPRRIENRLRWRIRRRRRGQDRGMFEGCSAQEEDQGAGMCGRNRKYDCGVAGGHKRRSAFAEGLQSGLGQVLCGGASRRRQT